MEDNRISSRVGPKCAQTRRLCCILFVCSIVSVLIFMLSIAQACNERYLSKTIIGLCLIIRGTSYFRSMSLPCPISFNVRVVVLLMFLSIVSSFTISMKNVNASAMVGVFTCFIIP